MDVNNESVKVKNRLLVRLCISEISAEIDTISQLFYQELFHLDSQLKRLFSSDEEVLNRTFINMMAIFKNAKHLDSIKTSIEKLAERHILQYGVQIEYLPTLKKALLFTLKTNLGERFNAELDAAWNDVFDDVADIMQRAMADCDTTNRMPAPLDKTEFNMDLQQQAPLDKTEFNMDLQQQAPLDETESDSKLQQKMADKKSHYRIHHRLYNTLSHFTSRHHTSTHPNLIKTTEVFMANKNTNPYANLNLREQIYLECRAMAEYALAKGAAVPASAIKHIEDIEDHNSPSEETEIGLPKIRRDVDISALLNTHDLLVQLIQPATPKTVLLLDMEQRNDSKLKFLGAVALIRQLMIAAMLSLLVFVLLMASPYIDADKLAEDVLTATGLDQFARLFFYISAAGLGASFAALYQANSYISKGTYDPSFQASYWIRFSLGIIAGLLLAILISEASVQGGDILSHGVVRPLLAILGGFSADLLYTFLNRMEETFKSLFESSTQNILDAKSIEANARLASLEVDGRMKLAQDLMQVQQQIGATTDPEEVKQQVSELLQNLMQPNRVRE